MRAYFKVTVKKGDGTIVSEQGVIAEDTGGKTAFVVASEAALVSAGEGSEILNQYKAGTVELEAGV